MKSILSLGAVYLDITAYHFPIPQDANQLVGTETVGKEYEMVLGGSALNFVRFCQKLGLKTYFIGKTGKDAAAKTLETLFEKEGITPFLAQGESEQTNINANLTDDTGKSIMLSFGNANQSVTAHDVLEEVNKHIHDVDILYLGGVFKLRTLLPSLEEIILFAKENKKIVALDHGRIINTVTESEKEVVRNLIESVDIYLPSKDEFLELWNVSSIEEGLLLFKKTSLSVVVKDAENGAYTLVENTPQHIPGFPVTPINTIGAGDSFNTGFITALSDSKSLEDAIRFANATAALKILTNQFPTRKEIEVLLTHVLT